MCRRTFRIEGKHLRCLPERHEELGAQLGRDPADFQVFKRSQKVIYTTNAIESLNSTYKKLNRQRTVFPSDKALLKSLYLSTLQATKKWTQPLRGWGKVYGEFAVMYEGRIPL